jgi:hypothetical protein
VCNTAAGPQTERVTQPPRQRRILATSPFRREEVVIPSTDGFHVGDRVTLDSCGLGRVVAVSEHFVTVDFGTAGTRRVAAGARGFSLL